MESLNSVLHYTRMIYKTIVICSGLICAQSCFTCVMQAFAYPFIVGKLKVPVPYLAVVGTVIQSMIVI